MLPVLLHLLRERAFLMKLDLTKHFAPARTMALLQPWSFVSEIADLVFCTTWIRDGQWTNHQLMWDTMCAVPTDFDMTKLNIYGFAFIPPTDMRSNDGGCILPFILYTKYTEEHKNQLQLTCVKSALVQEDIFVLLNYMVNGFRFHCVRHLLNPQLRAHAFILQNAFCPFSVKTFFFRAGRVLTTQIKAFIIALRVHANKPIDEKAAPKLSLPYLPLELIFEIIATLFNRIVNTAATIDEPTCNIFPFPVNFSRNGQKLMKILPYLSGVSSIDQIIGWIQMERFFGAQPRRLEVGEIETMTSPPYGPVNLFSSAQFTTQLSYYSAADPFVRL